MAGRTAEALTSLGTDVADKMLKQGADMTMSVGALRNSLGLSDEEVRRVCENANRAAFANYYYNSSGEERNPQFELANPDEILGDSVEKTAHYLQESNYAQGFTTPQTDGFRARKYRQAHQPQWQEKSASVEESQPPEAAHNPAIGVAWETSHRELDKAREVLTVAEHKYYGALDELRKEAAEVLRYTPVEHFTEAIIQASYGRESAAPDIVTQLQPVIGDLEERALLKHAEWRVNPPAVDLNHPLISSFARAADLRTDLHTAQSAFVKAAAKERMLREAVSSIFQQTRGADD